MHVIKLINNEWGAWGARCNSLMFLLLDVLFHFDPFNVFHENLSLCESIDFFCMNIILVVKNF